MSGIVITAFEDLFNELIYEIFEFLDLQHAFQGFYDLNERFRNLFVHSNLPIKINISSISKSIFYRYLTDIIVPHTDRIQSLRLINPFTTDMSLLLLPIMTNLARLETLIINNIESKSIDCVVDHLSSLPILSSLTIISIDDIHVSADIYQKLFRLSALKYCQMLVETNRCFQLLSVPTKEFSLIKHLIINNKVSLDQVDILLSNVPQLRRLSLGHLDGYNRSRIHNSSIVLNYLTDVSLKLYSVNFDDFELLVADLFHQVQALHIEVFRTYRSICDTGYVNASRWEQLIATHITKLRIFNLWYEDCLWGGDADRQMYEVEISKFNSLFWIQHQWFFEHQYYRKLHFDHAIFYSTNPYQKTSYMLCEIPNHNSLQTRVDAVHRICIHNTNTMKRFMGYFANAIELILSETFDILHDSIVTHLNRLIPLRQLTKLTLQCRRLSFEQVIELLYCTPNIHTFKLDSVLFYGMDSISVQQNTLFQSVSNTNVVTNLTVDKEITLEEMQLLVVLFPRLEYLTVNFYEDDLEPIVRFLLSKPNDNTRHLFSLCMSKERRELGENLRLLIESENLLGDYILKTISQKLYLWW